MPIAAPNRCPVCSAPPAEPAISTGTARGVIVTFGEITRPPRPPTSSAGATAQPAHAAGATRSTRAAAAIPSSTPASPRTVGRRPHRSTSRPPNTAETAEPSANGATASPDCSGVHPSPVWKNSANTSQIPENPTK